MAVTSSIKENYLLRGRLLLEAEEAATALQEDMPYLHTALASTNPELQQACLFPSYQQLAMFAEQHKDLDLSDALELFANRYALQIAAARTSRVYDKDTMREICQRLSRLFQL